MKVSAQHAASVSQNPIPCRNIAGISKNIGSVGSTNQNVDCARAAMRSTSPVSRHNQRMARIETKGSDKITAQRVGERRANAEQIDMIMPDNAAFMVK